MPLVVVLHQSCKGIEDCGICMFVCPKDLFEASGKMNQAGYLPPRLKDMEDCTGCENCMIYCPDMAVVVEKEDSEETGANEEHDEQGR